MQADGRFQGFAQASHSRRRLRHGGKSYRSTSARGTYHVSKQEQRR